MKIVWVVNMPIGPVAKMLNLSASSGLWLSAALDEARGNDTELYVICTCDTKKDICLQENGVTYLGLSLGTAASYKHTKSNLKKWQKVLADINPDILQIWGTEYQHALSAIMAKPERCKVLVYVQGIMDSVYNNYYGGIDKKTLASNTSLIEFVTGKSIFKSRKSIKKSADNEKQIISRVDGLILETEWAKSYYKLVFGCKNFYYHALPLNKAFTETERIHEKAEKHTIFTPASDYPLKGVHQLIKAIWYVKKEYPDIKLYIPGYKLERNMGLKQRLKTKCYRRYLYKLIHKLDLWNNVEFTGALSSNEMAERMKLANVFVCCSAIENHSSTLREAMRVGVPCISTCVGGVPELVKNTYNGELYDFNDVTALASHILKLFDNEEYANLLGNNAKESVCEYYNNHSNTLMNIYTNLQK